jgi:hypothetical protein
MMTLTCPRTSYNGQGHFDFDLDNFGSKKGSYPTVIILNLDIEICDSFLLVLPFFKI